IDEVNNLGAARIRVRSLIAAIRVREREHKERQIEPSSFERALFTREMRDTYTILAPQMSPIHFSVVQAAVNAEGYHFELLPDQDKKAVDLGLKYVNNDACYPSLLVVGQLMDALTSGKYDLDKVAVVMTQTGGGCRASNYIVFFRRALKKAGLEKVPVLSLNFNGFEPQPGFKITVPMLVRMAYSLVLGDVLMKCLYRMRPYEMVKGSANDMYEKWNTRCQKFLSSKNANLLMFNKLCRSIIHDFDNLPITNEVKPRVGIVGEILVKFSPAANNYLVETLEKEGAEAVVPDLLDFFNYSFYNLNFKVDNLGFAKSSKIGTAAGLKLVSVLRSAANSEYRKSKHFTPSADIAELAKMASPIVSTGNQTGEGWFLTGEMLELIHNGAPNIVCIQPFACLPNHIVGKGVIKEIRRRYPEANIAAVDYDPGASEVNQLNRIKLMLTTAEKRLEEKAAQN
ncbi:MAG: 2-hydroxyacyl-CoA dehydratase, partial [Lachnospiraceae bacterium]|nr:2-hydroxyacyl-CoA dehydratase [Lachnospiraceae bacterium]